MSWAYHFVVAGVTIGVGGDSDACSDDMWKFLKLYQPITGSDLAKSTDLTFKVTARDDGYHFICQVQDGDWEHLWFSHDAREVTAALEIHLYSKLVQFLDGRHIVSVHSSLLNVHGHAVMFAGISGAGKSSICTAGLLAEASYFSDEFSLLDEQGDVHPFPRPMQWEHPTHPAFNREDIESSGLIDADYFDFPNAEGGESRCYLWHPKQIQRKPLPLKHIVLHQYKSDIQQAALVPIPRYEAMLALPEHLHIQRGLAKDLPMLNRRIHPNCQFYRLQFPNVFEALKLVTAELGQF